MQDTFEYNLILFTFIVYNILIITQAIQLY